jgi:hypothetical protein
MRTNFRRLLFLAGCFVVVSVIRGESPIFGAPLKVRLIGPQQISIKNGTCLFWELPYAIEFTWDRDEPLELGLYVRYGVIRTGPNVQFVLHDEKGTEVEGWSFASVPVPPAGHILVFKGQKLRIPLHAWNGMVKVKAGRTYTISAKLDAMTRSNIYIELVSDTLPVEFVNTELPPKQ